MALRGMHVIYLYADTENEWNCSQWRAKIPADSINAEHEAGRCPHTARLFLMPTALDWAHPQVNALLGAADVIIFQRNVLIPPVWEAMDYWRAIGKAVLVDLDDHYPGLPPSNPAYNYWIRNGPGLEPEPVAALAEGLRHADGLTSPSKVILKDWEHIVPGYWLPNWTFRAWYAPFGQKPMGAGDFLIDYEAKEVNGKQTPTLRALPRPNSEGTIILGWGGSISHVDSWLASGVMDALTRLFEKYPQLRLKFCGHEARLDRWLAPFGERVLRQGGVGPKDWPHVVSTFDIGLAPLDTRPIPPWREGAPVASYDERRSWLKGVEYLSAGVPWVGSKSLTYNDLARWGTLVDNTPEAWFGALDWMLANLAREKEKAWDRRRWALKRVAFEPNVSNYFDTFGRVLADKAVREGSQLPGIYYVEPESPNKKESEHVTADAVAA